jgi:hypothetical protein
VVCITITQAAFEAIAKTLPFGSVGYENKVNEKGERLIWWTGAWSTDSGQCVARVRATATSSCGWLGRHSDARR